MRIQALQLRNFRNYTALAMEPDEGLCVLTGENAAGKTNVLESIFLSALGRSHRTTRDAELIRSGAESGSIKLTLDTRGGTRTIECRLIANERKRLTIDGAPLARSGELLGCLNVVMFAPEDLILVKGGPAERRRFLDMEISQLKPAYYYTLQRYNAALKQRNALLKDPDAVYAGMIEPWDEQLSRLGAAITVERAAFLQELSAIAADLHLQLSDHRETLLLAYQPNLPAADAEQLARVSGSQAQQRTTVLSLKLSEIEIVKKLRGEAPVLLLDDVFSELDRRRQQMLLATVQGCQTFLTCTHLEELTAAGAERMQVYSVKDGRVIEV